MRSVITLLSLLLLTSAYSNDKMIVNKKDGTKVTIELTSETAISFSDGSSADKMTVHKTNSGFDIYNLSDAMHITISGPSGIEEEIIKVIPVSLLKNYPNPFNPSTTISFDLGKSGMVSVAVYNQKGELVKELAKQQLSAGSHSLVWDANSSANASGIYFSKISIDGQSTTGRMVLVK